MPSAPQTYRDLIAWQKAVRHVMEIYQSSNSWPRDETDELSAQIRRSAVSMPSNIAEGSARRSFGELFAPAREIEAMLAKLIQRVGEAKKTPVAGSSHAP